MQIYAIYDRKMQLFQPTFVAEVNSVAFLRSIADGVKRAEGSLMATHPEDFDVMQLGEFDQRGGVIVPTSPPRFVENVGVLLEVSVQQARPALKVEGA